MRAIKKINDDILKLIKQKSENDNDRDITGLDPIDTDFFEYDVRDPFAKDRGRIVFTRAFRRLEHKAQVYPPDKGDHYRTRLTHTMEVVQISRSISRNLCLNENLAESIAF
jgi:dGTP triphosphohydrolase